MRELIGSTNYYGIFVANLSRRLRPINDLLKQAVTFTFAPATETIVRHILSQIARPSTFVYPG